MARGHQEAQWEHSAWIAYNTHLWSMAKKRIPYQRFNPMSLDQGRVSEGVLITSENIGAIAAALCEDSAGGSNGTDNGHAETGAGRA